MIEDLVRRLLGIAPSLSKINHDLGVMRSILKPMRDDLIPFEEEKEMELMSLKHEIKSQKDGLDKLLTGAVQSIYYEPMIVFGYKDYVKGVRDALLCVQSRNMEFVYRIRKMDVDVYMNGSPVAVIDRNGMMQGVRSKEKLASIQNYSHDSLSIRIRDQDMGHLFNPRKPHSPQQRAFSMLRNLTNEEERIFLAIGLYELVTCLINLKISK